MADYSMFEWYLFSDEDLKAMLTDSVNLNDAKFVKAVIDEISRRAKVQL